LAIASDLIISSAIWHSSLPPKTKVVHSLGPK
jgi:hypothetical protein